MRLDEVKDLIAHYYPKGIYEDDTNYKGTEEFLRRKSVCESADKNERRDAFLKLLKDKFPDMLVEDWSHLFNYDMCYRYRIYYNLNSNSIIVLISLISPFFFIYFSEISISDGKYSIPKRRFKPEGEDEKRLYSVIQLLVHQFFEKQKFSFYLQHVKIEETAIGNNLIGEGEVYDYLFTRHII